MAADSIDSSSPLLDTALTEVPVSTGAWLDSRPHPGKAAATAAPTAVLQNVRLCMIAPVIFVLIVSV